MAIHYNSKISTDGLVLCLDAGNSKSYPGTGTTWTDLSGNGNNGTLSGFFNGVKKNTVAKNIGATNNGNFTIGTEGSNYGGGSISYIQLYNRALSDAEIQQNYNALKGRFQ